MSTKEAETKTEGTKTEGTKTEGTKTEAAAQGSDGIIVIGLRALVKYEEVEKKELVLDFGELNGDEIIAILKAAERDNGGSPISYPALDPFVQKRAAAKAAGVQPGLLGKLEVRDFLEVAGATRDFLLGLRSS